LAQENVIENCKNSKFHQMIENLSSNDPDDPLLKEILAKGKYFTKDDVIEYPLNLNFGPNHCFFNAQLATRKTKGKLEYFEGYAINEKTKLPLYHAFNFCRGKVVDYTWSDGIEYVGINIPLSFIKLRWHSNKLNNRFCLLRIYLNSSQKSLTNWLL